MIFDLNLQLRQLEWNVGRTFKSGLQGKILGTTGTISIFLKPLGDTAIVSVQGRDVKR